MESTRKHGFLEKYQGLALRYANDDLVDNKRATSDSTVLAVVLLMISAVSRHINALIGTS